MNEAIYKSPLKITDEVGNTINVARPNFKGFLFKLNSYAKPQVNFYLTDEQALEIAEYIVECIANG